MSDENTELILRRLEEKFDFLETEIKDLKASNDVFVRVSEGYQKAADRVANLAFTVVGAADANAVISPGVKTISEYLAR
jgi:hypothetical protein